ncbi:exodeoxyribonuclease VII large subunit [Maribellus maritimus]|uniref:exodeoxyribonuclease VII large subunit n=1 Tax=Maribellus maritimus TaxID=2870838 RepID=UPI001EEAE1CE|nr:exodeoxyribonuclease VII large subunit [Maribellus maritimus]MCG6190416.1 exodeoxyribonuclease VII large subunit [Maribellus maritimus]
MEQKLSLSQLNVLIKEVLFDAFPSTIWVVAEISEMKENRSGHCYLELIEKEEKEIVARSRATIWSYTYRMLKPYFETTTGQLFAQGIKILVQVTVEYHASYGLSLNIKDIDPTYTVGDLALQRKEIIERLQSEGVFNMNKELELPEVPQKIAIISSKTAAGYQDFQNQLDNNEYGFYFYTHLFEAYMQGAEAVPTIIQALERIFQYEDFFDAVVIIRGGGATADLSSFDNYELALNVTQFPLPVITGIGHEKDDTIIDLVAHTRLKTPTAVAEFLVSGMERFYEKLLQLENNVVSLVRERLDFEEGNMERKAEKLQHLVSGFISDKNIRLIKLGNEFQQNINRFSFRRSVELSNFKHDVKSAVSMWSIKKENRFNQKRRILKRVAGEVLLQEKSKVKNLGSLTGKVVQNFVLKEKERIHLNESSMRLLNPENVLKRGYTLTLKEGKIIKSVSDLQIEDNIETRFADGKVKSKITKKENDGS